MGGDCVQQLQLQFIFICDSIIFLVACHYYGVVIHCIGLCCVQQPWYNQHRVVGRIYMVVFAFLMYFGVFLWLYNTLMYLYPLFLVSRSDQARRGVICQDVVYIRLGVAAQQLRVACNHWVAKP